MTKYFKLLIWPIAIAPVIYLGFIWQQLPEQVAMHFDWKGNPDRYGNKTELLVMILVLAAMSAGIFFLLANIYKIDPKKYAADNKDRLKSIGFCVGVFLSALSGFILYSSVKGSFELGTHYILAAVGILFSFLGNYMHTIKPNYFAGIRVPWTLNNEENWRKTHLLAGKLWFAGGLVLAALCLLLTDTTALIVFFTAIMILVIVPVIYSYRLYQKQNATSLK